MIAADLFPAVGNCKDLQLFFSMKVSVFDSKVAKKAKEILYMDVIFIFFLYVIIVNITGFAMMGIDKAKARRRAFRIPEARLFFIALIGGSIGSILGMYTFHHKTRHWYFVWGMPAILVVQTLALCLICSRLF